MRLAKLELLAYGPFRGLALDLEAPGLHVVFGRNEAGKSTTLRAITGLLYGIERSTRDAHVHKPTELRIGGVLASDDGARVHLVRRKGNANTLLDPKGDVVSEDVMTRLLRGISEETFRHAFGLDHDTLRRGAEALLAGKGDLGESLFDASVGGGGEVQRLLERLEKEADGIYRPRGQSLPLNDAIKAFTEAQKTIKERQSSPEASQKQEEHLAALRASLAAKQADRREVAARRAKLDAAMRRAPLERKLASLEAARAALGAVAEHVVRLSGLEQRLGAHDLVVRTRRELEAELTLAQDRVQESARRAGVETEAEVRVDVKGEARLSSLLAEREKTATLIATLVATLDKARRDLASAEEAARAEATADDDALVRALASARALGDAEARVTAAASKLARKRRELEASAAQAGFGTAPLEEIVARVLPPAEHVEALALNAADLDRAVTRLAEKVAELDAHALQIDQQIAALAGDFAPPDLARLRAARGERDTAWQRLRAEFAAGAGPRERVTLEVDVERSLRVADDVADRMIREAERVTTLARLRSARATCEEQLAQKRVELEDARRTRAHVDEDLAAAFARSGLTPGSFADARALVLRAGQLRDRFLESAADVEETETLAAAVTRSRVELAVAIGLPEAEAGSRSLVELVAIAASAVDASEARRRAVAQASRDVARLVETVAEKEAALASARGALADVCARFAEIAAPLGIPSDASSEEVTRALDALRELTRVRGKRTEVHVRAEAAARDVSAFEEDVARLARELAPDLASLSARDAASELVVRAKQAVSLDRDLATTRQHLEQLGNVALSEEDAALAREPEAAARTLEELDEHLAELERSVDRLQSEIPQAEYGLTILRSESGAADAAGAAQEALARVRLQAERWCRAKVAATLLAREIDRFREENQGPLLTRASALFARLTLGAYGGVKAGFDDKDRPCLLCVRDDQVEVRVDGLSEGTRDQLYLALRLSSLERHADVASPMPLVLDDVLIQLDDERARAALVVLAEIATRTQVLFFTHHARLVELARGAIPTGALHVHELAPRPPVRAEGAALG